MKPMESKSRLELAARAIMKVQMPKLSEEEADMLWRGFGPEAEAALTAVGVPLHDG